MSGSGAAQPLLRSEGGITARRGGGGGKRRPRPKEIGANGLGGTSAGAGASGAGAGFSAFAIFVVVGVAAAGLAVGLVYGPPLQSQVNGIADDVAILQTNVTSLDAGLTALEQTVANLPSGGGVNTTILDSIDVYVDGVAGSDSNSGSEAAPVATIDGAMEVINQYRQGAVICRINIVGILDLGTDPVICTNPIQYLCKHMIIRGGEYDVTNGEVDSVTDIDASIRDWRQVTPVTGGLTPALYRQNFIRNNVQNRVFVVDNNTETSFDVIATDTPDGLVVPYFNIPPAPTQIQPFNAGETFTAFTLNDTLAWTGVLVIDVPYNTLVLENLILIPTTTASRFQAPSTVEPHVMIRGCQLHVNGVSENNLPNYQGSLVIQGAYIRLAEGRSAAFFNSVKESQLFLQIESAWFDKPRFYSMGTTNIIGAKFNDVLVGIQQLYGTLRAKSLVFDNMAYILRLRNAPAGTVTELSNIDFYTTYVSDGTPALDLLGQSVTTISLFKVDSVGLGAFARTQQQAQLIATNPQGISVSRHVVRLYGSSHAYFAGSATVAIGPAFYIYDNAHLELLAGTIDLTGLAQPVVSVNGGKVLLTGNGAGFAYSTDSGTPVLLVNPGGTATKVGSGNIVNGGATSTDVIKCGTNAITAWLVTENDVTTNSFCTRFL